MQTDYSTILLDGYRDDGLFLLRNVGYFDTKGEKESKFFRSKSFWALHYVRRGKGQMTVRGRKYDIQSGMFFLMPPFEQINYHGLEDDPWCYFYIAVYPDSVIDVFRLFSDNGNGFTHVSKNPQRTQRIFETLFENRNRSSEEMYFASLNALMRILSYEFSEGKKIKTPVERNRQKVDEIKNIMHFNYKNPEFSISDIAAMLHTSNAQISRLFKQETGETPISFLVRLRLNHTAWLLDGGSYSIARLCNESGFNDECYFMKRFKKQFGVSVKGYRKNKNKQNV